MADSGKETVPGLFGFNPYHIYKYKKAIRQGTEKDRTIRVNIVGNYGQGKTSLTRRLIGKSCQGIESTNGIEINRYRCTRTGNDKTELTILEDESQDFINRLASIARSIPINPPTTSSDRASSTATTHEATAPAYTSSNIRLFEQMDICIRTSESGLQFSKDLFKNYKTRTTTTTKKSSGEEHKTDIITNDRITVKVPTISREEFKFFEAKIDEGNDPVDVLLDFWDFGGQYTFYATHTLFHSRKALYLLVFDLSSPLDKNVKDEEFPGEADEKSMEYYARFWMESIHFLLGPEPQVILIGTHKDKLDGDERAKLEAKDKYFHQVRSLFDNTDLIYHIQPEDFAVSNHDSSDADFDEILKAILQKGLAIVNTSEIPGRWVALEKSLKQEKHHKIIQFCRVREINEESECPLKDDEELKLFLKYHHEKGTLLYFDEEPIRDHVVLDPRYVVDAFKCIITTRQYRLKDPCIRKAWHSLSMEGKLTNVLIEKVWADNFLQHKSVLLAFLCKHLIVSRIVEYDDTSGGCAEREWYIIPSLLKDHTVQREKAICEFLDGKPQTQIRFLMHFEEPRIVQIIYHRLLAAALGKWPVVCCGKKRLLYQTLGVLKLKGNYAGIMEMRDSGIELQVCNISGKILESQVSDGFRRFAESVVSYELGKLKYRADDNSKPFLRKYRCNHVFHKEEGSHITGVVDQLNETDTVLCPDNISHIDCSCSKAYAEWFLEETADTIFPKIELSEKTLGIIAQTAIGRNWEFLGLALKIKQAVIDHIKADIDSDAMRIYRMLRKWKEKETDNATLDALANAMTSCPNVFVDWDEMRNIKDRLTGSSNRACTASLADQRFSAFAESNADCSDDQEPLKFVRRLEDQRIEVTPCTVHFECELSKSVPVQWFFNSRKISPSNKFIVWDNGCIHGLEIKDVCDRDEGKYCIVAKQETSEASIFVQDTEEEKRLLELAKQQELERRGKVKIWGWGFERAINRVKSQYKYGNTKPCAGAAYMSTPEPIQKSTIYIPHEYANKPIGDEFGADVWTYQTPQTDGTIYSQHFLVKVKHDWPAAKLRISDNDEIVLLNAIFVPNVTHTEVLNIFQRVKVDRKTRLVLVLRRLLVVGSRKEWALVETSALLAPDCHRYIVEEPTLKKLEGSEYEKKSYYKVPGTQSYLDIKHDSVVADVLTNTDADKTKIICRIVHYKYNMEEGTIEFTAALYSETASKYIVVGQEKQIKLDDNPMWFEMTKSPQNMIMFKINGLFLACNTETLQIETRESGYMFKEKPVYGVDFR